MDLTTSLNNPAERRKQVRLKVRPDLQIFEQKYEGKTYHVVKDPVCLRYYRFNKQEYFVVSILFMLSAGAHVALHYDTFYAKLPAYKEFFTWNSVLYMWISLGVVKVIHEFGHGLSCKAFRGECHEMGFLFMCLSPALYCNV